MKRLALLLIGALCLVAAPPVTPSKSGLDPERLARIPARMNEFVGKGEAAGIVTLVQRHGVLASLDAVGFQDLDAKKQMRKDSIFQIASMTKPVTGVAIMMLVEEGKISLGDPVEKYLPEFRGMQTVVARDAKSRTLAKPARLITIRDLMTHTSGMAGDYPESLADLMEKGNRTLAEAVLIFSQQPLVFQPGTQYLYSNMGINTLGRIVELVSDQPFERFCESRIFQPLGMKDTFFIPPTDKYDRIAVIYDSKNGKLTRSNVDLYRKNYRFIRASGGLFSTAADLAAFYQMTLNGGGLNGKRLLSKAAVETMTAIHTDGILIRNNPGIGWGLTWQVVRDARGGLDLHSPGSYGHGGAYGTQGRVDPKKDMVTVFMIQRNGGGASESNAFHQLAASAVVD